MPPLQHKGLSGPERTDMLKTILKEAMSRSLAHYNNHPECWRGWGWWQLRRKKRQPSTSTLNVGRNCFRSGNLPVGETGGQRVRAAGQKGDHPACTSRRRGRRGRPAREAEGFTLARRWWGSAPKQQTEVCGKAAYPCTPKKSAYGAKARCAADA